MRVGSDIVLLGGLINYVLTHDKHFHDYVVAYTNAAALIDADFVGPEDLDGLFSGFDPETGTYDTASWQYSGGRDETLTDPQSVFQLLKRHFARYTPDMVEQMCGVSAADFDYLARSLTDNSGPERTGCFGYATGWTQHTMGAQVIRTAGILQLLLGNVGRPGSGIMALRVTPASRGRPTSRPCSICCRDICRCRQWVNTTPSADYVRAVTPVTGKGYRAYADAYTVSLLKAWWGDAATAENDGPTTTCPPQRPGGDPTRRS